MNSPNYNFPSSRIARERQVIVNHSRRFPWGAVVIVVLVILALVAILREPAQAEVSDDDVHCQQIANGMEVVGGNSSLIKEHCARFGVTI